MLTNTALTPFLPYPLHCHIQLLQSAGPHRPVNPLPPFLGGALLSGFFSLSSDSSCLFVWLQVPGAIRQGAWSFEEQGVVTSALWGPLKVGERESLILLPLSFQIQLSRGKVISCRPQKQ